MITVPRREEIEAFDRSASDGVFTIEIADTFDSAHQREVSGRGEGLPIAVPAKNAGRKYSYDRGAKMGSDREPGEYFVYALLDPKVYRQTKDELRSIFYVGKGRDSRSKQHAKDVRKTLRAEEHIHERLESKEHRIHQILDRGETIPILFLAEGMHNEDDAYNAEQLAMTLVDGLLRRTSIGTLTNAMPGRHQGVRRVGESEFGGISEWETRIRHQEIDIGSRSIDIGDVGPISVLLVKGSRADMSEHAHRLIRGKELPAPVAEYGNRIKQLDVGHHTGTRRGWDPDEPWDDLDASGRARRYWQLGLRRVASWLRDPQLQPTHLLLAIPTPSGESVVRYAWKIDPDGTWEFYPAGHDWGVPLGGRDHDHPFLNHALYETRSNGHRVQVLQNYAAGWRHLRTGPMA